MFKVELDMAKPGSVNECLEFFEYCEARGVIVRVLRARGPAGGNPLVELSSPTREALERFVMENWGEDWVPYIA